MFAKTIEALKAAEAAAQKDLDALFVPYDPKTGSGGIHWNASGSGILQDALRGLGDLRGDLEKRQDFIDAQEAQAKAEAAATSAQAAAAESVAATASALALAEEQGVDLSQIQGTGEGGKITKADVVAALPPNATEAAIAHAAEVGVDLRAVKGTGTDGKITKADVEAATAAKESANA